MKQSLLRFLYVFAAVLLITGCSTANNTEEAEVETTETAEQEEVVESVITVTISEDEGEIVHDEKEIEIEEGAILMDVLKESFDIEEEDGFITAIDGIQADEGEQRGWMYYVNDEMAMVGAAEYELEEDDHVVFDLQAWE
ncbi:MAG TPA: DUF4430 domain-containing protein [Pseudogracilibacillus sp.]|nr:DUF4430 domain-containing protein [Pseudogracilibacillus sp.]